MMLIGDRSDCGQRRIIIAVIATVLDYRINGEWMGGGRMMKVGCGFGFEIRTDQRMILIVEWIGHQMIIVLGQFFHRVVGVMLLRRGDQCGRVLLLNVLC